MAEGVRLAYVAATRARDLLVVPAVGDEPYEGGWVSPLNRGAVSAAGAAPDAGRGRGDARRSAATRCWSGRTMASRRQTTVSPGLHRIGEGARLRTTSSGGIPRRCRWTSLRRSGCDDEELIAKDVPPR